MAVHDHRAAIDADTDDQRDVDHRGEDESIENDRDQPRSTASTTEIERLITVGEPAAALVAGEALLSNRADPDTAAQVEFLMSTAHLRLPRPMIEIVASASWSRSVCGLKRFTTPLIPIC